MERHSSIERIVGNIPEAEKNQLLDEIDIIFNEQNFADLEKHEIKKTPEQSQIISLINAAINEIRNKYGLENFDIPPANIHILAKEWWQGKQGSAHYVPRNQGIVICEQPVNIVFMKKVFHEVLHFKSYNSFQITDEDEPKLGEYRVGLTVETRDKKKMYFRCLNEAVAEELSKRYAKKLFNNPLFEEERRKTEYIILHHQDAVVTGTDEPLFDDDTFYAAISKINGGITTIETEGFSYQTEREALETLVEKIFLRHTKEFDSDDEVFEVFAKGMMTGNILPLGKLIDKTFGNGTYRRIGEIEFDSEAFKEIIDRL